jgi:hypothetical protein
MNMGKLAISFYGPFVSLLDRDPVEIYSPRCFGHYTGIFTTDDEAPLERDNTNGMSRVFQVSKSGIQPSTGKIAQLNPRIKLLSPPLSHTLTTNPRLAWFCIKLPKPKQVVGISPHEADITGTGAPRVGVWATGLRLIFDYDMDKPDFKLIDSNRNHEVFATTLKDHCHDGAPSHFEMTVRSVGPLLTDPDHEDARACFEASTRLFESENLPLDWGMEPVLKARAGSDCGTAHIVRL